jgi:translation initiation factor IF-1
MKTNTFTTRGTVQSIAKNAYYVNVDKIANNMMCYLAGKMMMHKIKPVIGDEVEIEFDQTDLLRGRIVRRL